MKAHAVESRAYVTLTTPEGVPLRFELAKSGSRFLALCIDLAIMIAAIIAVTLFFTLGIGMLQGGEATGALILLCFFLIRNFYFTLQEIRLRGQTWGKRITKIRVVARDGGPLTPGMIFARNLSREVEIFIPIYFVFVSEMLGQSILDFTSVVFRLTAMAWILFVLLLPLFHPRRARLGDLVAGTLVIEMPRSALLPDLVQANAQQDLPDVNFTPEQLDVYGVHELQVLEDVLRTHPRDRDPELMREIAQRIKRKIDWVEGQTEVPPGQFLKAFYAAQRGRLERQILLGRRRERKRG